MTGAYYNEHDPFAAAWLRELVKDGLIAPGEIDERSIEDVTADDLRPFRQCHFFAGIGIWSLALREAGWPDDRPVWTGSCPCQPFSAAGKGGGEEDERHLWPVWFNLIEQIRPPVIFGEQVSSSLAVGRRDASAEVQRMWDREGLLRLCQDWLEKDEALDLQGVPESSRERVGSHAPQFDRIKGKQAGEQRESACGGKRPAVRSDRRMGASEAGQGHLRGERPAVRHEGQQRLEHAVTGPAEAGSGLHDGELPDGSVCLQRGLRGLGGISSLADRLGGPAEAPRAIRAAYERHRRELEEANGQSWVNSLQIDLEAAGYAFGAVDTCAAGFGAPHIRQRLFFVGLADAHERGQSRPGELGRSRDPAAREDRQVDRAFDDGRDGGVADAPNGDGRSGECREEKGTGPDEQRGRRSASGGRVGGVAKPDCDGRKPGRLAERQGRQERQEQAASEQPGADAQHRRPGPTNGIWRDADWLRCRDGKWRAARPGSFPLADAGAVRNRVGTLRGAGNAITLGQAQGFIKAVGELI